MIKQSVLRPLAPYIAAASLWASAAHGQDVPSQPSATAVAYAAPSSTPTTTSELARGNAALGEHRYQDAVDAFTAAYSADGDPRALMNLGITYTNMGMLTHAVETLTRYTARADPIRDAETIAAVKAEIESIRSKNGAIVVNVSPATASIQVDGLMVSPIDGELLVTPGHRRFVLFAEGYVSYDQNMAVAPGRFALDVTLTPVSAAPVALAVETTTPAQKSAVLSDAETADEPEASTEVNCALASVCVGPVLALIGPPNLFGGGLHFRVGDYFGAGVDYQITPSISFDPVSVSSSLFSINARVYPFGGAFFLGGGFGYQSVRGELANSDVTVAANASFPAAMASLGFMGRDGFVLGMDLGVMFPLGPSRVEIEDMQVHRDVHGVTVSKSELNNARDEVQSQVSKLVDALPVFAQLNLLRIGYLF